MYKVRKFPDQMSTHYFNAIRSAMDCAGNPRCSAFLISSSAAIQFS